MNLSPVNTKKYTWLIIKIIVSVVLLTYLLLTISVKDIYYALRSSDLLLVFIAILLTLPISYLSAFQMHYLTRVQHITISILQILKIQLITNYYNLFLPGVLSGVAVKWYKLSKYGSRAGAAAVVLLNRFIQTFTTVLLGIIFFIPELYRSGNMNTLSALVTVFVVLILFYFLLFHKILNRRLVSILYKLPSPKIIRNKIHQFLLSMDQFHNFTLKEHLEINVIVLFNNLIGTLSFTYFAMAIDIKLDILTLGWIRAALSVVSLLPFSFAGLGVREGSLVLMLDQYGVLPQTSMALSFLFFLRNLMNAVMGGVLEIISSDKAHNQVDLAIKSVDDVYK